jgi:hypothetical protein
VPPVCRGGLSVGLFRRFVAFGGKLCVQLSGGYCLYYKLLVGVGVENIGGSRAAL